MDNKNIQLEIALRAKLEDIRLLDNWRLDLPGRVCLCGEECIMSGDCIRRKLMVGFDPSKHHKDREITYIKNLSGEFPCYLKSEFIGRICYWRLGDLQPENYELIKPDIYKLYEDNIREATRNK
ncbi:MAG: hypothetical protein J6I84_02855 [Bacilli bacterium]|nr:hypothetical protein [Bacilli bacterium]